MDETKMDPKLLHTGLSLLQTLMGSGTDKESMRRLIQEELKSSQSRENSEMLKQMLSTLEQKHAADVQELNLEKEKYKMEVEFLRKQLEDAKKEKKSAERTDKVKDLLNHLSALSLEKQAPLKNYKQKEFLPQSCSSQSNSTGSPLPWMDSSKGGFQSTPRGHGNRGKGNYHSNYTKQNSQKYENTQTHKNYQQFQNTPMHSSYIPQPPVNPYFPPGQGLLPNPNLLPNQNIPQNPNFHPNQNMTYNPNFQSNPDFPQNQNIPQHGNFQQKQNFQQTRGQSSNRYRGKGQRGNSRGGRGRSSSLGRDTAQMNKVSGDTEQASYHIKVTKVNQSWMSSENVSCSSDASSQRGRGNSRGGGRGRGRGNMNGAQTGVKKNRRQNQQTEHAGNQWVHVPRNKQKNNEEDPEDNCVVS